MLSGTTQMSQYQKGKCNLDFTKARDSEWQWHQLGHMQICTSSQIDNTPATHHPGRMPFLPPNQQYQSTECTKHGYKHQVQVKIIKTCCKLFTNHDKSTIKSPWWLLVFCFDAARVFIHIFFTFGCSFRRTVTANFYAVKFKTAT